MASGDLTDLISRVRDRGSFSSADVGLTDTRITTAINAALKQIAAERDWPWLFASETITTADGTATYTPHATWVRTDSIIDSLLGESLVQRQSEEIARYVSRDRPVCYAVFGDQLLLGPTPDGVYSLIHRYVKKENTLTSGANTPLIPNAFDEGVVEWATMLCHAFARQDTEALSAEGRYKGWLHTVQDTVDRTRRPRRVQVRAGAGW